jgi:cell division protein FtsI (penicillin-binding protein 3)
MAVRDEIVWRSGVVYVEMALLAALIVVRIFVLQFVQHDKWEAMSNKYIFQTFEDIATRGDILTDDGRLLASSVPYYTIYMDTRSTGMAPETWKDGINGLCEGLARVLGERSAAGWRTVLTNARSRGDRYFLIKRRVDYETLSKLKALPIFKEGKFKGGMLVQVDNQRIRPNGELAARTIGYLNLGGTEVGIEGAFDKELAGKNGAVVKQRLVGGDWITVDSPNSVISQDGNDVITTINIDLQDVASSALAAQLRRHNARSGCAILMEVKTGDIKAIANLELGRDGAYHEAYNYALGASTEPGSTFKLPVLMAAIEDGIVDTGTIIDTGVGYVVYSNKTIRDSRGYGKISVNEVFEKSSNVGTAKIVNEGYRNKPQAFVDRLYSMGLNKMLDLQISGEGAPIIRSPGNRFWSALSLPMMSHGYEVALTPLQTLAFYNAVANDGKLVRPRFVSAIAKNGVEIKRFEPEVIISSIASQPTIQKARIMMERVVERGTATNLKNSSYKIAGKTGTAQIAQDNRGYRQGGVSYQASFVGYFPADNPLYSCIVIVSAPSSGVYYGNVVAGTVFKEISDRVFATEFYKDYKVENSDNARILTTPDAGRGYTADINHVLRGLGLKTGGMTNETWAASNRSGDTISLTAVNISAGLVPDVRGMSLRDAVYLLESHGLRVRSNGRGRVLRQYPEQGARFTEGSLVTLEMNM